MPLVVDNKFDFGRRRRRRRGMRKRGPSNKSLAKSIRKINNKMELKQNDVFQNAVSIDDPFGLGLFTLLNGVATGDTDLTRDGAEVHATSVQFRGTYITNTAAISVTNIRMIVFWDSQPNGAAPTMSTLLDSSVITDTLWSPYNRDYQKRYKILYDKTFAFAPVLQLTTTTTAVPGTDTTASVIQRQQTFKKKVKLNRTIKYSGTTSAITDIATNSLYVFQVSNQPLNSPVVIAGYRVYFKDN